MGHEFSKVAIDLECSAVKQQDTEWQNDDVASTASPHSVVDGALTPTGSSDGWSIFPGQSVIIFDWDDTLLCSSAVNQNRWSSCELEALEIAVDSILHTSMSIAETLIVTNGNATWVQDSARKFLPRLLPTLEKLQVVSARAMFEFEYPGDPFMWKEAAFKRLLTEDRKPSQEGGLNLVALGDQMPEIKASHSVTSILGGPSRAKTVKFKEHPSVLELIGQLNRTEKELAKLVAEDTASHRSLSRGELSTDMAHQVSQAEGWKILEATQDIEAMLGYLALC
eukprot:CAMPEP_0176128620 /NCGR_PEP_ID=MMETSP0120_2-20121206/65000_1 /TAXON_ID=160619 /ORGANISM="Kryptoperidinium foliaceum, Strain CCMP 1326" /LENGTH=280 /DNA_ID=CAMNT_0017463733 /DNA_START=103 /DNA_END=945 /DNA_ORIENTATION=-